MYECSRCNSPTRMTVLVGISAPAELSHQFSKTNLRSKEVWLTHVNWETADYICTNTECGHVSNGYGNYVTRLEATLAERQWIPVSERLPRPHIDSVYIWPRPDFGNEVHTGILTSTAEDEEIAWYVSNYISGYGIELVKVKVTHWMPLPNPPEQEGSSDE